MFKKLRKKVAKNKGFTLIELIVCIGIFTVISSVTLVRFSEFNTSTLVTNLAYEVALAVRQAQINGLSVRGISDAGSAKFDFAYGVHFDQSYKDSEDSMNAFVTFSDIDGNTTYTAPGELIEKFTIPPHYKISKICSQSGSTWDCTPSKLDIIFRRPNPNANIYADGDETSGNATVCLESPQKKIKQVVIYSTGQISIPVKLSAPCDY